MADERIEYSTKMMKHHRDMLQRQYDEQIDNEQFDEIAPQTNLPRKARVAENLTAIKITKDMVPEAPKKLYKLPPNAGIKVEPERNVPEVEYKFTWEPKRLEARPFEVPADFGRDYLQDELIDLVFQFSRLSTPN